MPHSTSSSVHQRSSISLPLVTVSSRFRITLATVVQAASSAGSSCSLHGRFAHGQQLRGGLGVASIHGQLLLEGTCADTANSAACRLPRRRQPEGESDSLLGRRAAPRSSSARPACATPRRRSGRSSGSRPAAACWSRPANGAGLAVGGVESRQRRRRRSAFPERVHRPAIQIRAVALLVDLGRPVLAVFARGQFLPQTGRLIRRDARSADPRRSSSPLTARAWSRMNSACSRSRGARASRRFSGSCASSSGVDDRGLPVGGRSDDQPA